MAKIEIIPLRKTTIKKCQQTSCCQYRLGVVLFNTCTTWHTRDSPSGHSPSQCRLKQSHNEHHMKQ